MKFVLSYLIFENEISLLFNEDILKEPRRTNPTDVHNLGIIENGGLYNIINTYNEATTEEKEYWGKWYYKAKAIVEKLAEEYQIPLNIMAGIVATLSPGNRWNSNITAAKRLIEKYKFGIPHERINSYSKQIEKARKILETGDLSNIIGPKVTVFYKSLVNPDEIKNDLVLDSHAINIWRGDTRRKIKKTPQPSKSEREQMIVDYKKASEILGVSVQEIQAVTWYIWKFTKKQPEKIEDLSKFLLKQNTKKANDNIQNE
jgi:hypothetical protein